MALSCLTKSESTVLAAGDWVSNVPRSAVSLGSRWERRRAETGSPDLASLAAKAGPSAIEPAEKAVALFSIWIQPARERPSKSETGPEADRARPASEAAAARRTIERRVRRLGIRDSILPAGM